MKTFEQQVEECKRDRAGKSFIVTPPPCEEVVAKNIEEKKNEKQIVEPDVKKRWSTQKLIVTALVITGIVYVLFFYKKK